MLELFIGVFLGAVAGGTIVYLKYAALAHTISEAETTAAAVKSTVDAVKTDLGKL